MTRLQKLMVTAIAAAAFAMFGAGVAGASPSVWGKTFSEASEILNKAGYTARVVTTVGDQLPWSDCIVISQADAASAGFGPSQYMNFTTKTVLLALNCNARVASTTDPGNSAASPEGRKAKFEEWERNTPEGREWWQRNTAEGRKWCADALRQHPEWAPGLPGCQPNS